VFSALCFIPLLITHDVALVTIALTIFALFRVGIVPVTDALALTQIERHGGSFGRYRQWGSLGFIAGGFLLGATTKWLGGRAAIPWWLWAILMLTIGLAYWLPSDPKEKQAAPRNRAHWTAMRRLVMQPLMSRFLVVVFLWRLSSQGLYAMLPLHLESLGIGDDLIPAYWAIGVVSEITMFRLAPRWFEPRGRKTIIMLCFAACLIQYSLLAYVQNTAGVAAIMLFHGLSFGMAYYTCVTWLGETVEPGIRAAGQGLFQVVAFGLGGALSTLAAGALFEHGQGPLLFTTAAAVAACTIIAGGALLRVSDGWSWTDQVNTQSST
jgi:PPP family 3-phenylpropionic acid transporter